MPRRMMTQTSDVARDVLDDVRSACERSGRTTGQEETRRVLEALDPAELDRVRRVARSLSPSGPLGPDAIVDIARGTAQAVAQARELGGYYTLMAERDALAHLVRKPTPAPAAYEDEDEADEEEEASDDEAWDESDDEQAALDAAADFLSDSAGYDFDDDEEDAREDDASDDYGYGSGAGRDYSAGSLENDDFDDEEEAEPAVVTRRPARRPKAKLTAAETLAREEQTRELITLFAYHRDAVRVAQELQVSLSELSERVEDLGLKRRIHQLLEQTTDIQMFSPERLSVVRGVGRTEPVLRRRGERPSPSPVEEEIEDVPELDEGPAAVTTPVTPHGTRVYRRVPAAPQSPADASASGRREYVREPRRKARPVVVKPPRPAAPVRAPAPEPEPAKRPMSALLSPESAAFLEQFLADEKANPRVLAAKLGEHFAGSSRDDLDEADLRRILEHHGLDAAFGERETANTRFLIGFHQGARGKLSNALLMSPPEVAAYLQRLGLADELEQVRTERARIELGKSRLQDRIAQVLTRAPYLDDLGVLSVIDREVRDQLDAMLSRLAAGRTAAETGEALREELDLQPNPFAKLLRRYDFASRVGL